MADLNRRYKEGAPTRETARAGVFFHTFDLFNSPTSPWLPRPKQGARDEWSDTLPVTLANARSRCPFHAWGWAVGLLINPAAIDRCALCGWATYAASQKPLLPEDVAAGLRPGVPEDDWPPGDHV